MPPPRVLANYGAPYVDAVPVADPEEEQSSDFANVSLEDLAQMSRTSDQVWCTFTTTTGGGPATVTAGRSHAGSGSGQFPVVTKTATGKYTITYPSSFVDGLGTVEAVSFAKADADAWGAGVTGKARIATIAGSVITIEVRDNTETLSDLGGTANITVSAQ